MKQQEGVIYRVRRMEVERNSKPLEQLTVVTNILIISLENYTKMVTKVHVGSWANLKPHVNTIHGTVKK